MIDTKHRRKNRRYIVFAALTSLVVALITEGGSTTQAASPDAAGTAHTTNVLTYHNDIARTGQNVTERTLNTTNVNPNQFGKLLTYPVDGQVYSQPLIVTGVTIPRVGRRNVVYVTTAHNSVYAFDADAASATSPLWQHNFNDLAQGITPVDSLLAYPGEPRDIFPEIGIIGTPVIDKASSTLYVVVRTQEPHPAGTDCPHEETSPDSLNYCFYQRLHALNLTTGTEKKNSPVTLTATVPGTGAGNIGGMITFDPLIENQRAALMLNNGVIYIAWASHKDFGNYHGWIMGYNARTLKQTLAYVTTPTGRGGGIWQSGAGLSADSAGNIFAQTGNGDYSTDGTGKDYGESFLKLHPDHSKGLSILDHFTPFNQECLEPPDLDLGASTPLVLPPQKDAGNKKLLVGIGKEAKLYLIDRTNMGGYTAIPDACSDANKNRLDVDKVVTEFSVHDTGDPYYGSPAYWQGTKTSGQFVYVGTTAAVLKAYRLQNGTLPSTPTTKAQQRLALGWPGATPSISSNGQVPNTGIVWTVSSLPGDLCPPCTNFGILTAYDATNLDRELFDSEENPTRDRPANYLKFAVPTVANGRVYVGTKSTLEIYGLLPH